MEDRNGLKLSSVSETPNAYYKSHMHLRTKDFRARAWTSKPKSTITIGSFADARDAAYVAEQFGLTYSNDQIDDFTLSGSFREIAKDFIKNISIPEWRYPSENVTFKELEEGVYKTNRSSDAREALRDVIISRKMSFPPITRVKAIIAEVEKEYSLGLNYRDAAQKVLKGYENDTSA